MRPELQIDVDILSFKYTNIIFDEYERKVY
jgi:hypothetical protein